MSQNFVLGRENVPCVAEVVNRSLKADCTDFTCQQSRGGGGGGVNFIIIVNQRLFLLVSLGLTK